MFGKIRWIRRIPVFLYLSFQGGEIIDEITGVNTWHTVGLQQKHIPLVHRKVVMIKWGNEWESIVYPMECGTEKCLSQENRVAGKGSPTCRKWVNLRCGVRGAYILILKILLIPCSTFTSLVYFSKDMVSKPLELLCVPTCCLSASWQTMPPLCGCRPFQARPQHPLHRGSGWPCPRSDWRTWRTLLLGISPFGDSPAMVTHVILTFLFLL